MTLFELVKIALDELYAEAQTRYGTDVDARIKAAMEMLKKSYGELTDKNRQPVDYRDPATRFAYVYKYTASHGDYIYQILYNLRGALPDGHIFGVPKPKVSCIGGGPGSDIIGIVRYLDKFKAHESLVTKVTCFLLDKQQAWADTWTEFEDAVATDLQVSAMFQPLDVTDPSSYRYQQKFLNADLFTMSYFLSEVHSLNEDGSVSAFLADVFSKAKSGAFFLYVDNGSQVWNDFIDQVQQKAGLKVVLGNTDVYWTPSYDEEKSQLGAYLTKFGEMPKLRSRISYRVFQKP
jgi:Putative SAM-dependent methyltransferase